MYPMPTLQAFFEKHAAASGARWWIGTRPQGFGEPLVRAIAAQLGYPAGRDDPFRPHGLKSVPLADAAHVLAVAATTSLAFSSTPRPEAVTAARTALQDLQDRPRWIVNGWFPGPALTWVSLTSATFDCGVIGYDMQNAFIFWVEEED